MLLSPNNRRLGCSGTVEPSYASCREAIVRLREGYDRVLPQSLTVASTGQWMWQVDLDGATVAVSCRSYLRARECTYNLDRFLEAVPTAQVVEGTRGSPRDRLGRGFGVEVGNRALQHPQARPIHIEPVAPYRLGAIR